MADYDVIVIGAGLGGLTAGSFLAANTHVTWVISCAPRWGVSSSAR